MEGDQDNKILDLKKKQVEKQIDPKVLGIDKMYLSVSGVIESGQCEDELTLQCRYSIESGEDWKLEAGITSGESQTSTSYSLQTRDIVFNFPFEATYSTSCPSGWPQIVVTVRGPDFFGRPSIKGYGSVHFPTEPGYHERTIRLFKPVTQSVLSSIFGFLLGQEAQYSNAEKVISKGEGREVTRVRSVGTIKVKFQVMKRNFQMFGYQ